MAGAEGALPTPHLKEAGQVLPEPGVLGRGGAEEGNQQLAQQLQHVRLLQRAPATGTSAWPHAEV